MPSLGLLNFTTSDVVIAWIFAFLALLSCLYWGLAWWRIARWRPRLPEFAPGEPVTCAAGISVLKPLHGVEPQLPENLRSFIAQHYSPFELLCGVQDAQDPVLPLLEPLQGQNGLRIVRHTVQLGSNPKVNNLAGIYPHARYPILVLADADIRVGPDYLAQLAQELDRPGVGVSSCLYRARTLPGLWSQVLGVQIQEHFLPSVLAAAALGPNLYCGGATIALRRDVFERCGGFAALADELADDYAIGAHVRALGYRSIVSDVLVETLVAEDSFRSFYAHALRWARTTRAVQPWGHAFSFLTYPLPLVLIAALCWQGWAFAALVLVLALRLVYHWQIGRKLHSPLSALAVGLADFLGLSIWAHAQIAGKVHWRGRNFSIDAHGQMHDGVER